MPPSRERLLAIVRRHLSTTEDDATASLIARLRPARSRGYLTKGELEAACYWKSPRAIHHVRSNSRAAIRSATRTALATTNEIARVSALIRLRGVSIPMASSLLTLVDPRRYGVLDIRVWQLLHREGVVTTNRAGARFTVREWEAFLEVVRGLARTLRVNARDVERALFDAHRARQRGRLYSGS